MATTTIYMVRNDTKPYLDATLTDASGDAIDLTDTTVTFTMVNSETITSQKVLAQECTILNSGLGQVRYEWESEDTNTAGTYLGQFQIEYADESKLTIPTTDSLAIIILEDYDAQ
jgi:hypothetical protein